ncbi:hypothetical protein GYA93_13260 [Gordonia desulfuricans]|uniref:Serine/threonine protein kinase n=1 Tax=Gordonia desulfuricans TaxID=89051 RepID=A0A7K3LQR6_9ACTN|nr:MULTISPECIES: hypothetical protein [Gordonia]NDK90540.1 hypothetical protein [Gordonia desulfuricans]WLP90921.1 hypothetical protein Q9K23_01090 [Gordonia sp. NB41Y]
MTSTDHTVTQAWPTCGLGAWAAAWVAGRCSPDDVADTLAGFAGLHLIDDHAALPTTGIDAVPTDGTLGLLAVLRRARNLSVRLPDAGAPQGLPPDPATAAALTAGETLLVDDGAPTPLALIPTEHDGSCRWSVYRYGVPVPVTGTASAGEIEYELREAVSETAQLMATLGGRAGAHRADLRGTISTQTQRHLVDLPPHDDARATRLLGTAAQVEAIVSVATLGGAGFGATAGQWETGDHGLRRLVRLAHAARAAAVNRVIGEFLPGGW